MIRWRTTKPTRQPPRNSCSDGSYAKAHDIYPAKINASGLSGEEARWVAFRSPLVQLAFASPVTNNADTTKIDEARDALDKQIRDLTREDQHDRVWAEVEESLGDFSWARRNYSNWGEAWPHYRGARLVGRRGGRGHLRERYLNIVWHMAKPPGAQRDCYYGCLGQLRSV